MRLRGIFDCGGVRKQNGHWQSSNIVKATPVWGGNIAPITWNAIYYPTAGYTSVSLSLARVPGMANLTKGKTYHVKAYFKINNVIGHFNITDASETTTGASFSATQAFGIQGTGSSYFKRYLNDGSDILTTYDYTGLSSTDEIYCYSSDKTSSSSKLVYVMSNIEVNNNYYYGTDATLGETFFRTNNTIADINNLEETVVEFDITISSSWNYTVTMRSFNFAWGFYYDSLYSLESCEAIQSDPWGYWYVDITEV